MIISMKFSKNDKAAAFQISTQNHETMLYC